MKTRKFKKNSGHIMLPANCMIVWMGVVLLLMNLSAMGIRAMAPESPFLRVSVALVSLVVLSVPMLAGLIAGGMYAEILEAQAERLGLGASQIWSGKSWREKVAR